MKKSIEPSRIRDLRAILVSLEEMHLELVVLIREKIGAMKQNDLSAMRDLTAREQALAEAIQRREGMRRQLMDAVAIQMGWTKHTARALSLSQLAAKVPDSQRCVLLAARSSLREAVAQVAKANRVAGVIAREISEHLAWVFASVRPIPAETAAYCGSGGLIGQSENMILDAVG